MMEKPLIIPDLSVEAMEALLQQEGLSEEERSVIIQVRDDIAGIEPEQNAITALDEERRSIAAELKEGRRRIPHRQIAARQRRLTSLKSTIAKRHEDLRQKLMDIHARYLMVKRIKLIHERTEYRSVKILGDWYLWILEPFTPSLKHRATGALGATSGIGLLGGSIALPLLVISSPWWLIATVPIGATLGAISALVGFSVDDHPYKVFDGVIPFDHLTPYREAAENGLFDAFVVATPEKNDAGSLNSRVLCGMIFQPPYGWIPMEKNKEEATRYNPYPETHYENRASELKGLLYEIARW